MIGGCLVQIQGDPFFRLKSPFSCVVAVDEEFEMSETIWGEMVPGPVMMTTEPPKLPKGRTALVPSDLVRLPPEMGGAQEPVKAMFMAPCPCGKGHEVWHLYLVTVKVAECTQFLWYR